jgi:hypothetical protein
MLLCHPAMKFVGARDKQTFWRKDFQKITRKHFFINQKVRNRNELQEKKRG